MSFQHNESLEAVSPEEGVVESPIQESTSRKENVSEDENTEKSLVLLRIGKVDDSVLWRA
jgi:hypothetical protein